MHKAQRLETECYSRCIKTQGLLHMTLSVTWLMLELRFSEIPFTPLNLLYFC